MCVRLAKPFAIPRPRVSKLQTQTNFDALTTISELNAAKLRVQQCLNQTEHDFAQTNSSIKKIFANARAALESSERAMLAAVDVHDKNVRKRLHAECDACKVQAEQCAALVNAGINMLAPLQVACRSELSEMGKRDDLNPKCEVAQAVLQKIIEKCWLVDSCDDSFKHTQLERILTSLNNIVQMAYRDLSPKHPVFDKLVATYKVVPSFMDQTVAVNASETLMAVSTFEEGTVTFYALDTGCKTGEIKIDHPLEVCFGPSGDTVLFCDGMTIREHLTDGTWVRTFEAQNAYNSIDATTDKVVAFVVTHRRFIVFTYKTGEIVREFRSSNHCDSLAISPNGMYIAFSDSVSSNVGIVDMYGVLCWRNSIACDRPTEVCWLNCDQIAVSYLESNEVVILSSNGVLLYSSVNFVEPASVDARGSRLYVLDREAGSESCRIQVFQGTN